jgi:hypothetical protein
MKNKLFLVTMCIILLSACGSSSNYYSWPAGTVLGENTQVLQGTIWAYTSLSSGSTDTIEFRPGGKLVSTAVPSGNHTWRRSDTTVEILYNNGYASYTGTIDLETQRIRGTGKNANGATWEFAMTPSSVEMMLMDAQQKAYERQEAQQRAQEANAEAARNMSDEWQKAMGEWNKMTDRINQSGR